MTIPTDPEVTKPARETCSDDPLLKELWKKLPTDGQFPATEREYWLLALKATLDIVYGADAHGVSSLPAVHAAPFQRVVAR
jgi:hypothetical protein